LLACGDRQLVGCVRASNSVAEVSGRRRAQRSVLQWQRGAWTGAQLVESRKGFHGRKGVDNRYRGGKAMAPSRPEPGVRKGIAGAKVFARWKALQAVFLVVRSRGRLGGGLGGSHEPVTRERCESVGEATGVSEARRARITTGRQRPSRRSTPHNGDVQPAEANRTVVEQATPRLHWRASARCKRTNDARVLVRRSEMAEVGPTHRALRRPVSRKASRRRDAGQGALRSTC